MEFDFGNAGRGRSKESLASGKLQKAIERNRAKQAKRTARQSSQAPQYPNEYHDNFEDNYQENYQDNYQEELQEEFPTRQARRPRSSATRSTSRMANRSANQYPNEYPNQYNDELDLSKASTRSSRGRLPGSRLPDSKPATSEAPRSRMRSSTPRQAMGSNFEESRTAANRETARPTTRQRRSATGNRPLPGTGARPTRTATRTSARSGVRSGVTSERSAVATADNKEFTTSVKRSIRKAPAKANYATSTVKPKPVRKVRTVKKNIDKKTLYTLRFFWVFLGFLCLRLVFSGGGVIDYYTNRNLLMSKVREFKNTKIDNQDITNEIKRIKIDSKYQKKLVRDHLGFIASDEYVILFPKEKS